MSRRDEDVIAVGLAFAPLRGCIICRGPARLGAAFLPNDSEAWGAQPGKQRVLFYALCDSCHGRTSLDEIEARLAPGPRRRAA